MRAQGISEVVILLDGSSVQDDLVHVLARWQTAGIRIRSVSRYDRTAVDCTVRTPGWWSRLFYRALALSRLRRNNAGGFGAIIPTPGAGG